MKIKMLLIKRNRLLLDRLRLAHKTLSDQPLELRRKDKVFSIKYYPIIRGLIHPGGDFLKNRSELKGCGSGTVAKTLSCMEQFNIFAVGSNEYLMK